MHMSDALISPVVGGVFWGVSAGLLLYSTRKIQKEQDDSKVALMGVLGAFVFAAQMINFLIPLTGSSGHLGGGLLLSLFLGPYRAFITLASVITVQAFIFADGGILALGCNIFNMGFFPSFVLYPFISKILGKNQQNIYNYWFTIITASVATMVCGALFVVLQTFLSGVTAIPFQMFLYFMLTIHVAIGVGEGIITGGVFLFIRNARPEIIVPYEYKAGKGIVTLIILTLFTGVVLSWFASSRPDGLEWSLAKVAATEPDSFVGVVHDVIARIQNKISLFPDYTNSLLGKRLELFAGGIISSNLTTSVAAIAGSLLVCILAGTAGFVIRIRNSGK